MITTMIIRRLLRCIDGTAAVEAAIFLPIFLLLTFGITDIGTAILVHQQVNAAVQAGASYAVINSAGDCASLSGTCLTGIKAAMNDASGNSEFCTSLADCTPITIA